MTWETLKIKKVVVLIENINKIAMKSKKYQKLQNVVLKCLDFNSYMLETHLKLIYLVIMISFLKCRIH